MRYSEHFDKQGLSFNNVTKVWRGILIQTVVFISLFVFLSQINYFTKTYPEYGIYTFYLGLLSLLPSLFVLLHYFNLKRVIRRSFRKIDRRFVLLGKDAKRLQRCLTAGFVLADVTLLTGVAHLVITGNLAEASYLWGSALLLCVLYRPCVRYINCSSPADGRQKKQPQKPLAAVQPLPTRPPLHRPARKQALSRKSSAHALEAETG